MAVQQVFISYKREEQSKARLVYDGLRTHGIEVWWDEDLQAGQKWEEDIDHALVNADAVVVLWSDLSRQSDWVRSEASIAKHNNTLVNVLLADCEIPPPFRAVQSEGLIDWDETPTDAPFEKLVQAVKSKCRSNARNRSAATKFRIAAIVLFAALASCIGIMIASWLNSDVVITGTIQDENGGNVANATITIPAIATGITDSEGEFRLKIPASRKKQQYEVEVIKKGFIPISGQFNGAALKEIRLGRLSAKDLVQLDSKIAVGHYFGAAHIHMNVQFLCPSDSLLRFELKSLRLEPEDGDPFEIALFQQYFQPFTKQRTNAGPLVLLHPDAAKYDPTFIFADLDQPTIQLGIQSERALAATAFSQFGPKVDVVVLPKMLDTRIKSMVDARWKWKPSIYTLVFRFSIGPREYQVSRKFVLTKEHVTSMKKISSFYKFGFGCVYNLHENGIEDAHPFTVVQLQPNDNITNERLTSWGD